MSRREGPPGRETAAARSNVRRIWYGYGQLGRAEKNRLGLFLHDTVRIYAEVSVLSLPVLFAIMAVPATGRLDAKATGLVAWLTMTFAGTLIRGGWVRPLATPALGWVRLSPALLVLRVGYFNLALAVAAFGGVAVAGAVPAVVTGPAVGPGLALAWAGSVAVVSTFAFPRVAGEWLAVRR
jgi:hypothetical protein